MNEVFYNIITRRSVRKFADSPVPDDILEEILTAGLYAPSAMNTQPWLLTVVRHPEKLESLRKAIAKALERPDYHKFYGAPVLVIVTVPADYRHGIADTACVLENMFLAAHAECVGSVWINQLKDCCNDPEVRSILTAFGIPKNHVCYGCGAFGYADGDVPSDRMNKGKINFVP